jgi:hypothetical protein
MAEERFEADWSRAGTALKAAELLLEKGYLEDAVSRAYYSIFHAARAVLALKGTDARTHTGVRRLFGTELVSGGDVEPEWAKIFARAQTARQSADYDTITELPRERADDVVLMARRFVGRMAEYLRSRGVELDA